MSEVGTQLDRSLQLGPIGSQMWAGVYRGTGRVVLESIPTPAISAGEVLVRVGACGICGTDIKKIKRGLLPPPQVFGHEIAGTVVAVGREVTRWKPGDRVVSFHHVPCGSCFYCQEKLFSQCSQYKKVGVTAGFQPNGGGFAEYVRVMDWVAERGMIAIPPQVDFEDAVFVEPVNTCLKAIHKARLQATETAFVIGQGPIGLILMLLARYTGATVYTSDPLPSRQEKSLSLGAADSFDPRSRNIVQEVRARTEGRGADAVFVAAPDASLLAEALAVARPGGRILLFAYNDPVLQVDFPAATVGIEEKEILGSYSASFDLKEESARLVFNRILPLRQLVSHRFGLEAIEEALALAAHPSADSLKVVLIP